MELGIVALLSVSIGIMLMLVQRTERKRRLFVALGMLLIGEVIRRYIWYREYHAEGWSALIIALVVNFLYWALIGRYNPVGSSDRIHVYGLDD
jgi:thiamine transporter ThiT